MFGWFSPKCPLGTYEKTWTEWRMVWLGDQFGIQRLLQAPVILPTEEFFPDSFDGVEEDARRVFVRVCNFLSIDADTLQFEVRPDVEMPGAAGHYEHSDAAVIRIAESQLSDPESLVATLAHELSHELLLGGNLLSPSVADHEWVTDLLPVFMGLGIFSANSTVRESHQQYGNAYEWRIGKHGYLPARMLGYALALFAFVRGEDNPDWAKHLRLDALEPLQQGLRFLKKSHDSLFRPDLIRMKRVPLPARELAIRLQNKSSSVRLSILWEIGDRRLDDRSVVKAATACLADRDVAISSAACRALAAIGPAASSAVPQLRTMLSALAEENRAAAAFALGSLGQEHEAVVPELATLLADEKDSVIREAARALRKFGPQAEPVAGQLMAALNAALVDCKYSLIKSLAGAIAIIATEPVDFARDYYAERDPEMRRLALAAIKENARTRDVDLGNSDEAV